MVMLLRPQQVVQETLSEAFCTAFYWICGAKRDPVVWHNCKSLLQSNCGKNVILVFVEMFRLGYLDLHIPKMYKF